MRVFLMLFLLSVIVVSCYPLSPAYYQPPRENYETFEKTGASELDVKKAMLECGESPIADKNADINTSLLADWCMEMSGYKSDVMSMEETCKLEDYKQYPACQPGAAIPKPSVERRLNSKYCQSARDMISEEKYQQCLMNLASKYERVTEKDCAYWHRDLVEECQP